MKFSFDLFDVCRIYLFTENYNNFSRESVR